MFKFSNKSIKTLETVHPKLQDVVNRAIELSTVDFTVFEGLRTKEKQAEYVKKGVSKTMNSKHLTGNAVDLVPYVNGRVVWEWEHCYDVCKAMIVAANEKGVTLRWGGVWDKTLNELGDPKTEVEAYSARRKAAGQRVFLDAPHFELIT